MYDTCFSSVLFPFWRKAIEIFRVKWEIVTKKHSITTTNKIHIILHHIKNYIEETEQPLGRVSDQLIEATHAFLNHRLTSSNYRVKDISSKMHGDRLLKGIVHFN